MKLSELAEVYGIGIHKKADFLSPLFAYPCDSHLQRIVVINAMVILEADGR